MGKQRFLALVVLFTLGSLAGAQTEPAQQPKKLRISSKVAEGLKIHNEPPQYPIQAQMKGLRGDVLLEATIDTQGNITALKVLRGDPILVAASVAAVKKWKYRPYLLNGDPVEVETSIKIMFHM
jgi:periplasmic protein TonB